MCLDKDSENVCEKSTCGKQYQVCYNIVTELSSRWFSEVLEEYTACCWFIKPGLLYSSVFSYITEGYMCTALTLTNLWDTSKYYCFSQTSQKTKGQAWPTMEIIMSEICRQHCDKDTFNRWWWRGITLRRHNLSHWNKNTSHGQTWQLLESWTNLTVHKTKHNTKISKTHT